MKKTLIALATLIAIPLAASSALAMPGQGMGQGMRGGPNVEYMARVLDLTPEQQEKVKALFAEQARKRAEQRAAMQAETQAGMKEILTEAQFAKMNDLRGLRRGDRAMGSGMGRGLRADCPRR